MVMPNSAHPLARDELIQSLTVRAAWATSNGNVGGTSLVDAGLIGVNNFLTGKSVILMSGASRWEIGGITTFNPATGEITVTPAFSAQVTAGILYRILNFSTNNSTSALLTVPAINSVVNTLERDVIGNKTDTAIIANDNVSSIIRYVKGIISAVGGASLAGKPNVHDVVIYPVAEDAGVTELADDGSAPAFYPAAAHSTNAVGEGAAVAAWTEDINFEQEGTVTIISIYAEFEWQTRFLVGAGNGVNSVSKIQISRDGGANWVDLSDNFTNSAAVMTARNREGVGLWIPTIVAGANQFQLRLVHWVDVGNGISTSEAQIRSNSFVRITYRKS